MDDKILATFHAYDLDEVRRYAQALDVQVALSNFTDEMRSVRKYDCEKWESMTAKDIYKMFYHHVGEYLE
jgi:hypothetical protein